MVAMPKWGLPFRHACRAISPFPFSEPTPPTSAFALECGHSSTALWTDQVQDGRDDVTDHFSRKCDDGAHSEVAFHRFGEGQMRVDNSGGVARGVVRFLTLRIGWLRSPVVPNHSASSFSK